MVSVLRSTTCAPRPWPEKAQCTLRARPSTAQHAPHMPHIGASSSYRRPILRGHPPAGPSPTFYLPFVMYCSYNNGKINPEVWVDASEHLQNTCSFVYIHNSNSNSVGRCCSIIHNNGNLRALNTNERLRKATNTPPRPSI